MEDILAQLFWLVFCVLVILLPFMSSISSFIEPFNGSNFICSTILILIFSHLLYLDLGILFQWFSVAFFVLQDADIMWFRDPFPRFYADADFQIACDTFGGNPFDLNNRPNGGFNYVKSNNRTMEFYKFWYASREAYPGYHDQDVLNIIKFDPVISEIGLKIRFLNTAFFGGFCEPSRDLTKVCTMHANCCVGLDRKLHDLRIMLEDWQRFMSLPLGLKRSPMSSWRVPQNCR